MQRPICLVVVATLTGACGWFKELQSADSGAGASTGSDSGSDSGSQDSGSDGTGEALCEIVEDDRCDDQDTLLSCDEATGVLSEYSCNDMCTGTLNFSCVIASADSRHGCWCVVPGDQKLLTCSELESCLLDCSQASSTACADACFVRTNAGTVRTYGALVSCAHRDCDDTCRDEPQACSSCISSTIGAGTGKCTLERSVCDADASSDPWWPD